VVQPVALGSESNFGQTPLDPDEASQLVPSHLVTQAALNEWEQANILQAVRWLARARVGEVLTEGFCRELHRRMFGRTWKWAGTFRLSNKNIGCDWTEVPVRLRQLLDNARFWLDEKVYPVDVAAARFHHQLVLVHPFPNGNGRHARLMTDRWLRQCGTKPFSWGDGADLVAQSTARDRYLAALRAADNGDCEPLLAFLRS